MRVTSRETRKWAGCVYHHLCTSPNCKQQYSPAIQQQQQQAVAILKTWTLLEKLNMGEYPRIESQKGREQQRWAAGTPTEMAGALGGPGGFSLVELKKMEAAVGFYDGDGDSDGSMSMA